MSNGYQSLVTSFMLQPVQEKLLKSIDEFLASDIKLQRYFYNKLIFHDKQKYENALKNRVEELHCYLRTGLAVASCGEIKTAIIADYHYYKKLTDILGDGKNYFGLYLIPETVYTERINLFTADFHPYIEQFQQLMDRSFEAGLPAVWDRFYFEMANQVTRNRKISKNNYEKIILDFFDIAPFFLVLAFGFSIAIQILLWEIFYHEFLFFLLIQWSAKLKIWKIKVSKARAENFLVGGFIRWTRKDLNKPAKTCSKDKTQL